jgi:hypothetical protein
MTSCIATSTLSGLLDLTTLGLGASNLLHSGAIHRNQSPIDLHENVGLPGPVVVHNGPNVPFDARDHKMLLLSSIRVALAILEEDDSYWECDEILSGARQ